MESTTIPVPPSDVVFYQWLAGILFIGLFSLGLYAINRFVKANDETQALVRSIGLTVATHEEKHKGHEAAISDHQERINTIEEKVFIVRQHNR